MEKFYVEKTTTDKLGEVLNTYKDEQYELVIAQHVGGRDWVIIFTNRSEALLKSAESQAQLVAAIISKSLEDLGMDIADIDVQKTVRDNIERFQRVSENLDAAASGDVVKFDQHKSFNLVTVFDAMVNNGAQNNGVTLSHAYAALRALDVDTGTCS